MTTRLSRELIDRCNGVPGVPSSVLGVVVTDFVMRQWRRTLAYGEIITDDLNGTFVDRASIVLADGTRFALSGLEEPLYLRNDVRFSRILLTMVGCRRRCLDPDWCTHPREASQKLTVIRRELLKRIRAAER